MEGIKANELRVNNIVLVKGKIDTLHRVGDNDYISENYGHGIDNVDLEPIPLTEEILLKCDLTPFGTEKILWGCNDFYIRIIKNYVYKVEVKGYYMYLNYKLEHLHQLQNLYFALTNEELNIKL